MDNQILGYKIVLLKPYIWRFNIILGWVKPSIKVSKKWPKLDKIKKVAKGVKVLIIQKLLQNAHSKALWPKWHFEGGADSKMGFDYFSLLRDLYIFR